MYNVGFWKQYVVKMFFSILNIHVHTGFKTFVVLIINGYFYDNYNTDNNICCFYFYILINRTSIIQKVNLCDDLVLLLFVCFVWNHILSAKQTCFNKHTMVPNLAVFFFVVVKTDSHFEFNKSSFPIQNISLPNFNPCQIWL